jgi:sporulation protein YlmC with PRC-barrel domain
MTFWEIPNMSFELRLKKLRGSGGYIMASINDDQQRKGNLGGPDLFLAPVGRIDSEKISKFYCNTCEKDYEGAPRIQFENPNEEVAENLILVEKGQYVCTTCSSTLAEYREFKKPSESIDVGLARPVTSQYESSIPISEPMKQSFVPPRSTISIPDFDAQIFSSSIAQENIVSQPQQASSSFNVIVGMTVYDENAKKIGTVKQVGVDATQNVVLIITKNDGGDTSVKWNQIKKIGEVILLGEGQLGTTSIAQSTSKCSSCGFNNKPGSKFCQSCGSRVL